MGHELPEFRFQGKSRGQRIRDKTDLIPILIGKLGKVLLL